MYLYDQLLYYVLFYWLNGGKGALVLPKARARHTFLIVATLQFFCLPVPQQSKMIPKEKCELFAYH